MTISVDVLSERAGPRYKAIADVLAEDIASGALGPGARLPTHRDLAWQLGVTVGTVTRAYGELERRGLVSGEVGRGTYVQGPASEDLMLAAAEADDGVIDLMLNYPAPGAQRVDLPRSLRELADDPQTLRLLNYQDHGGQPEHRAAGAAWIARAGYAVSPDQVIVTAGAQHALVVALSSTTRPGDRIAGEELCFPGVKTAATMLGCRLEPLPIDRDGLVPEAVDRACANGIRVVCCVPSLQNPTNVVMSPARRQAIAEIIRRHEAYLIEDDLMGLMLREPRPPIAHWAPDNSVYLTSLSKTVGPGLRIGYIVPPSELVMRARNAVRATCWMAPPLLAEIAARWITDGTADRIVETHRRWAAERMAIAEEVLGEWGVKAAEGALHVWFELPTPWTTDAFSAAARERGVVLATEAPFTLPGAMPPRALRISLGQPPTVELLRTGLKRLADILRAGPDPGADLSIM